jgi:predicted transcriptional regulator
MLAKDIMTRKLVTLNVAMTLKEAAWALSNARVSGAPVVDAAGRMVGVLSQTDLVREQARRDPQTVELPNFHMDLGESMPKSFEIGAPETLRVDQVMTPVVLTGQEDFSVEQLGRMMLQNRMHRIVITRDGKPVGIVTPFDVLRVVLATRAMA